MAEVGSLPRSTGSIFLISLMPDSVRCFLYGLGTILHSQITANNALPGYWCEDGGKNVSVFNIMDDLLKELQSDPEYQQYF